MFGQIGKNVEFLWWDTNLGLLVWKSYAVSCTNPFSALPYPVPTLLRGQEWGLFVKPIQNLAIKIITLTIMSKLLSEGC